MVITIKNVNCENSMYDNINIDLSNCKNDNGIFEAFAEKLEFPEWFGYDWNAFDDCMLNLCFDVQGALLINLLNCDEAFNSLNVNSEYFLETIISMVSGEATQDNGDSIDVAFNLFFSNVTNIEKVYEFIQKLITTSSIDVKLINASK